MDSKLGTVALSFATFILLALGAASPSQAQMMDSPQWTVDGRGGLTLPTGDVSDLAIESTGVALDIGVGYHLTPRFVVRADGGAEFFRGSFSNAPNIRFFHYNAGVEAELTRPDGGPLDVTVNVAGGFSKWDTERAVPVSGGTFSETYPTFNGGVQVGYDVAPNLNLFLSGQWYQQFTDEDETAPLAEISPDLDGGFSSASSLPISLGLRLKL